MTIADDICQEILSIMKVYHRQESRGRIDTPGGLEHMGDVWRLFLKWEHKLEQVQKEKHP